MIRTRPSRDDQRCDALREIGCIACLDSLGVHVAAEIHHLVDKGYRKHSGGNTATIPLCAWHHRGEPLMDTSTGYMRAMRGPSMYFEAREFTRIYGTQRELLAKVNEMLSGEKTT